MRFFNIDINIKKTKMLKIIIALSIFLIFVSNYQVVYAFDFPPLPNQHHIDDKAGIISDTLENEIYNLYSTYKKEKGIDLSIVTIGDAVGEKYSYTKQLKQWWGIGEKDNGLMIAIYPNSKDLIEIIVDRSLEKHITEVDIKEFKQIVLDGVKNNQLEDSIKSVNEKIKENLESYSKATTMKQQLTNMVASIKFNISPKEKGYVFIDLRWLTRMIERALG